MAKKSKVFGVNSFKGSKRRRRKGRHAKKPNKSKRIKLNRGQGRGK